MFLHEQIQGHGSGVVSVHQLGAFAFELLQTPGLPTGCGLLSLELLTGLSEQDCSGGFEPFGVELDSAVVVDDLFLDEDQRPVLQFAGGALLVASEAEVVGVAHALLAGGVGDAEPAPAVPAPDGALQVVVMLSLLETLLLGIELVLHPLPGLRSHQGLVLAVVLDTVVDDKPLVIRRTEDAVHLRQRDLLAGGRRSTPGAQPSCVDLVAQGLGGPFAGGVGLEHPGDERAALGVDHHVAPASFADVLVADPGAAVGAAFLDLDEGLAADLVAQVPGVELVHHGQHALHELTGSGAVDLFDA
ncbi:MAG: hypothetical protein ABIP36_08675 [Acidimicrobiales bacterium]